MASPQIFFWQPIFFVASKRNESNQLILQSELPVFPYNR